MKTRKRPGLLLVLYFAAWVTLLIFTRGILPYIGRWLEPAFGAMNWNLITAIISGYVWEPLSMVPIYWLALRRGNTTYSTWIVPIILLSLPILGMISSFWYFSSSMVPVFVWMSFKRYLLALIGILLIRRVVSVQLSPAASDRTPQSLSIRFTMAIVTVCAIIFLIDQRIATLDAGLMTTNQIQAAQGILSLVQSVAGGLLVVGAGCLAAMDRGLIKRALLLIGAYAGVVAASCSYFLFFLIPAYTRLNEDSSTAAGSSSIQFEIPEFWFFVLQYMAWVATEVIAAFIFALVFRFCGYYVVGQTVSEDPVIGLDEFPEAHPLDG